MKRAHAQPRACVPARGAVDAHGQEDAARRAIEAIGQLEADLAVRVERLALAVELDDEAAQAARSRRRDRAAHKQDGAAADLELGRHRRVEGERQAVVRAAVHRGCHVTPHLLLERAAVLPPQAQILARRQARERRAAVVVHEDVARQRHAPAAPPHREREIVVLEQAAAVALVEAADGGEALLAPSRRRRARASARPRPAPACARV